MYILLEMAIFKSIKEILTILGKAFKTKYLKYKTIKREKKNSKQRQRSITEYERKEKERICNEIKSTTNILLNFKSSECPF